MGNLVTVTNNYDNGVCSGFTIYTGTTYNGHPFTIPPSANSIGFHTLPHTFDIGNYSGPLYVFLEHCDNHISPPPNEDPKKQGGFQVVLVDIDCDACPPNSNPINCTMVVSFVEDAETDCNFTVSFNEIVQTPTPTSTPTPTPTSTDIPGPTPEPDPTFTPTSTPEPDPTSTPEPDPTSTPVPDPTATPVPDPTATPVPDPTATPVPDPTSTPEPDPTSTPTSTPTPTPTATDGPCVCIDFVHISSGTRYGYYDDCDGNAQTITFYSYETASVCGNGNNITVSDPKLTYSIGGDCVDGACSGSGASPTSPPTSTPTSTPTPTPTSTETVGIEVSAILLSNTDSEPNNADCTEDNTGAIENRVYVPYNTTWFTKVNNVNVVKSGFSLTDNDIINYPLSGYTLHADSISDKVATVFTYSSDGTYMIADESTESGESIKLLFTKSGNYGTTNKCGGIK